MATERRRQQALLGALVVVLVVVIYRLWPAPSAAPAAASNSQGARGGAAAGARNTGLAAPDVHLEALETKRTQPGPVQRDLFRFKPKAAPPPSAPAPQVGGPAAPVTMPAPTTTPAAPQVPPITLKFIGVMESQAQKIAVLSDGRGAPFYGKEGDVVEGRYRILKIGVESIDIAYADGRGRQTIRLSGQ